VQDSLAMREYVQGKDLHLLRVISLQVELRISFHLLSYLQMKIGETSIGDQLAFAIINVEIHVEQYIV
jgi:hypothetical protein